MTATTAMYLQLQRVYRERADQEVAAVEGHLARLLASLGRAPGAIPRPDVRAFCKNSRNLRCPPLLSIRVLSSLFLPFSLG